MDAARGRVAATLEAARHIELERLIVGVPGDEAAEARRRALAAAATAGRAALVEEAREAALAWVTRTFSERAYSGTWAVTEMSMSVTRPADRAAVAEALADAVTADAVEDLIEAETLDALRARWDTLETAGPIPEPGSLSALTSGLIAGRGTFPAGIVLLAVGVVLLAMASVWAIAFLVSGLVIVGNALRGQSA